MPKAPKTPAAAAAPAAAEPRYFAAPDDLRQWLAQHAATATVLMVGFMKKDSGQPSITWPESVDEALCAGWIDGVRRRIDDTRYQIRFTPRQRSSHWSSVNIARMAVLIAEGRVSPAGLAAFEARTAARSGQAAYEQAEMPELSAAETRAFKKHRAAWAYFQAQPAGYRKRMVWRIVSAKQAATRQRRLALLVQACEEGQRL